MYKFYAKHVSDTVISKPLNITGGGIGRFDFCYYLLKYAPTVDWSKNNNNKTLDWSKNNNNNKPR